MRKVVLMVLLVSCFLVPRASAWVFPVFSQDDFQLIFGAPGQPGAAGGTFNAEGRILDSGNSILNYFMLSGTNPLGAYVSGTEYWTDYVSTLQMWTGSMGTGTLLWTGSGTIRTKVNVNGATYPAVWWHPSNLAGQTPSVYQSIGNGSFLGAGVGGPNGWSAVSYLDVPWFGTYNWAYDNPPTFQTGNIQGALVEVPEPTTLTLTLLFGAGLVALAAARLRKRT